MNITMLKQCSHLPTSTMSALCCAYGLNSLLTVIMNTMLLYAMLKAEQIKFNRVNSLMMLISVSDLFVGIVYSPLSAVLLYYNTVEARYWVMLHNLGFPTISITTALTIDR